MNRRASVQLDSFDLKILDVLQTSGRITNARLALDVGLSESACFSRVKRLEQSKTIQGYRALIAQRDIGPYITVVAEVTLELHKANEHSRFEQLVRNVPEIVECLAVTGQFDYLLKLIVRDMEEYIVTMDTLCEKHERVRQFFSYVVMRNIKDQPLSASRAARHR